MMVLMCQVESGLNNFSKYKISIFCIRYGTQEMNQSKDKPSTVLTPVKELGMKMNEKTVTVRGRVHTSRAKG